MKAIKNHIYAFKRATNLLIKRKFLIYFIPGIVIMCLFYLFMFIFESIGSALGVISYTPWIGSYLGTAVDSVFNWMNSLSIYFYQFTIITLLSPFHTALSQAVETHETGIHFKSNWSKFFNDLIRTLGVVIFGGFLYLIIMLAWYLLAWSLGLNFLSPLVSLILVAFFTGFNSYDYSLERHNVKVKDSWNYAFHHPLHMILTGLIFTALLFIPFIGVVIAPVLLTSVGTINYLKLKSEK
ncbi:EI24 domain-containing protein [Brumimicrobium aurantiacum]|uniref:EI24 domain-containing protein n=1 Tax=Brumimicrobium aurantiacum TaxID=1737063 RepID=A0A3E1EYV1_9FLAO|nr:EI24 domain-containing protein [Brumimicrobium aurantiacum]RFC54734.1 hypothetical protein DXU93_07040 [Brumimicrobium aurantiacum]